MTSRRSSPTVDSLLRGVPGVRTLLADPRLVERITHTVDQVGGAVAEAERTLEGGGIGDDELEAANAVLGSVKDAAWALERDRLRAARCVADLAGPDAGLGRRRRDVRGAPGALRDRSARGPRPRLGRPRAHRARPRPRAGRSVDPVAARRPRRRAVHLGLGPGGRRPARLRLQGRGRDRRAGRQHRRRCATRSDGDELLAERAARRRHRGDRPRPHPVGVGRHHLRAERAPAGLRRGGRRGRPVRDRRPQRRRRQLLRSDRRGRPRDRTVDHDRRQGHPRAGHAVAGSRAGRRPRPSARPSRRSRAPSPSARPTPRSPA